MQPPRIHSRSFSLALAGAMASSNARTVDIKLLLRRTITRRHRAFKCDSVVKEDTASKKACEIAGDSQNSGSAGSSTYYEEEVFLFLKHLYSLNNLLPRAETFIFDDTMLLK